MISGVKLSSNLVLSDKGKFVVLLLYMLTIAYFSNEILLAKDLYYEAFAEKLPEEQIQIMLSQSQRWSWLGYVFIPVALLLKIGFTSACLALGIFFMTNQMRLRQLFSIALTAEFVFLLPMLIKLVWFSVFNTSFTLHEIQFFYPGSLISVLDQTANTAWWAYPAQLINVFELVYCLLLARGVARVAARSFGSALGLVAVSYGTGLLLWSSVVVFFAVTYGQ